MVKSAIYTKCFLHFFDIHFLNEYRGRAGINDELLLATKFAFLCSASLVIPMSSYFENSTCREIIDSIVNDVPEYDIYLMGNAGSIDEFAIAKLCHYEENSLQYKVYQKILETGYSHNFFIQKKSTDTTGIIKNNWEKSVEEGDFFSNFVSIERMLPKDFREKCENIHSLLDGRAYIPDHINKILFGKNIGIPLGSRVSSFINRSYFSSYLDCLPTCAVVTELRFLQSDYVDTVKYENHIPYSVLFKHFQSAGLLKNMDTRDFSSIYKWGNDESIVAEITKAFEKYFNERRELGILTQYNTNNFSGNVGIVGGDVVNTGEVAGTVGIKNRGWPR